MCALAHRMWIVIMDPLHIAIDGPVGSGKTYIAQELAKKLGITYLYTGAMYRTLALACYQKGIAFKDAPKVMEVLRNSTIDLQPSQQNSNRSFAMFLNGENVTEQIFNPVIDQGASDVSTLADVRSFMVQRQREMAQNRSVVMEGRDIGLRVLPKAQIKIYLTASVEERAKRRFEQFEKKGILTTIENVVEDTKIRDAQDMSRETDPLQKLPDAWELDTTGMSTEVVLDTIINELKLRKLL